MENRYKIPAHIQKSYFEQVEKVSNVHGDHLASLFGVVGRTYRDWKRGKFPVPEKAIDIIEKQFHVPFPSSKQIALRAWMDTRTAAAIKGGLKRVQKYGSPGTPEGRSRGGKRGLATLRERGLIPKAKPFYEPKNYSAQLAEFVGILLGDGHIDKTQWTITLNATADYNYVHYVFDLVERLFHFSPSLSFRPTYNVAILAGSGIRSIQYLTHIGLMIGNKVKQQVGIPEWITKNSSYHPHCLRGLVDTDGGIFKHTYTVNNKSYTYTKLCFVNRSLPILHFVYNTLEEIGLNPKLIDKVDNKRVWLYNQNEVRQYLERVGTNNPRVRANMGG